MERLILDMGPDDQVLLIGDGRQLGARGWDDKDSRVRYFEFPGGRHGNPLRDFAIDYATCDFVMFVDDDDNLVPGAIDGAIRPLLGEAPDRPHVFLAVGVPRQPKPYHLTTPGATFVWPNDRTRLGKWDDGTSHSEVMFLETSLAAFPEPVLHDVEVYIIRAGTYGMYQRDGQWLVNGVTNAR